MERLALLTEPVALVGFGLVAISLFAFRVRAHPALRYGNVTLTVFFFWFASPLGANIMVAGMEDTTRAEVECGKGNAKPVVVILAGGISGAPTDTEDVSRLKEASFRRTVEGLRLANQLPGSSVILSGGSGTDVREADLMRALALSMGFAPERLLVERGSQSTHESALAVSRELGRRESGVFLVTSALHMRRSIAVFGARGVPVCPYAVDSRWIRPRLHEALIPQISALEKSTAVIHEAAGWLWYWASGKFDPL